LSIDFEENDLSLYNYTKNKTESAQFSSGHFEKQFKVGQKIVLPFLAFKVEINDHPGLYIKKNYFIKFDDFDAVVARYQGIKIDTDDKSGSILTLSLEGANKARMVDYLNTTVSMLIKSELDKKNLFATNTIKFIDSTLVETEKQLKQTNEDLKSFQKGKNIVDIELGGKIFQSN